MKHKKGHKQLAEWKCDKIDKLKALYEKDRYKARILYMNNTSGYEVFRIVLFTEANGDFSIVRFRRRYGVSKTNKMYSHEKRLHTVTYTKKKFWLVCNEHGKKYVTHLSLETLYRMSSNEHANVMKDCLAERFSWINHMYDERILWSTSFNTIVKNKVYSFKKALKFQFKLPLPQARLIFKHTKREHYTSSNLKYYMDYVDNIESLKDEWFSDGNNRSIFHDTLKMAKTLNKKINCTWTTRRLKEEHDKWAQEITEVLFVDGDRPLKIKDIYLEFGLQAGYTILKTTREMALEGRRNKHCVATYISKVDYGNCAIYRIGENTLEVVKGKFDGKDALRIGQIRGYNNASVPQYVKDDVQNQLINFNKKVCGVECSEEFYNKGVNTYVRQPRGEINDLLEDDGLPF
jgi:hypothetical protein